MTAISIFVRLFPKSTNVTAKHHDQLLSATLKSSKKGKNYFPPIEIYSEKTMT